MDLLVAGADRVDADNDYWFDHDDYRDATERGRLFGKDARNLAAASSSSTGPATGTSSTRLLTCRHCLGPSART